MDSKSLKKKMKRKNPKKKPSLVKVVLDEAKKQEKKSAQKANGHPGPTKSAGGNDYIIDGPSNTSKNYMEKLSSTERAEAAFAWLIAPVTTQDFYKTYFEKKPFVVRHKDPSYYQHLLSTAQLDTVLRERDVHFEKNIDLTSYVNGKRETVMLEGRAFPALVWQYYGEGCSVRLLNPQTYVEAVHSLCYTLAEHFSSFVGANVYLTPAGTQGFAPHWDDIDAFVLQLEGKKKWKVYKPRNDEEELPLVSSGNLDREELEESPIIETTLETGDLLYMPRGFIHEAQSCEDDHSLHITISANQKNTWSDYLKILLPAALELATESDVEFRKTLPRNYMRNMGVMHSELENSSVREKFAAVVSKLFQKLMDNAPLDPAADQMAVNYMHDSLPPVLSSAEKELTAGNRSKWNGKKLSGNSDFDHVNPDTQVCLVSQNCVRVTSEEETVFAYHIVDNTSVYRERDEPYKIEITPGEAEVIEFLVANYPTFVRVKDIPIESGAQDDVKEIIHTLYFKNLLLAK